MPFDSTPGLGHVLLSKIGWSQPPSVTSMSWDDAGTFTQGDWAGDRFEVRSYNEVKAELELGDWIDVTNQEAQRFICIWKADGCMYWDHKHLMWVVRKTGQCFNFIQLGLRSHLNNEHGLDMVNQKYSHTVGVKTLIFISNVPV